nr:immunoglobulin light chain junction region [Macaca mulatta]MOX24378.1 immunoglobulin light chain junction region [Macaca mulatta]MOX24466.1 immunoglobulin light chain junction region [Macaca mulatta]MOX24640.1 immunoglobulin light chain junction region [Macaca mulatta]MOX24730.1 immunoglobulin light chain junction region [Macaca mulatta]
CLHDVQLPPTF